MRIVVWLDWPEACFRANELDIAYLKSLAGDTAHVEHVHGEEAFLAALAGATHAITWHFKESWYALAPRLELVATPAAGRELVDAPPTGSKVKVHFGGFHGAIMAESVAAFIMAFSRGFFAKVPQSGMWPREWLAPKCYLVSGTKAVIAGFGNVGRAIARKLESLGIICEGFTRANASRIKEAARDADWFVMALPGDTHTDDFLDASLIAALPPRAVVVNVGRGNAIAEKALEEALSSGRIAGAYLDVFKNEPTQLNTSTAKCDGLWNRDVPNLIAMPHSSAFAPQYLHMAFKELKNDGCI